jgi:hypothetical protein
VKPAIRYAAVTIAACISTAATAYACRDALEFGLPAMGFEIFVFALLSYYAAGGD